MQSCLVAPNFMSNCTIQQSAIVNSNSYCFRVLT